jgi:hypothetical protein
MNVGQLRAFLAVARRGSFTRAAEDVGLSQSTLSLSVRQLENELGLKLLDRTTRQVQLTVSSGTPARRPSRQTSECSLGAARRPTACHAEQYLGKSSGHQSYACEDRDAG